MSGYKHDSAPGCFAALVACALMVIAAVVIHLAVVRNQFTFMFCAAAIIAALFVYFSRKTGARA